MDQESSDLRQQELGLRKTQQELGLRKTQSCKSRNPTEIKQHSLAVPVRCTS